MTYLQHNTSQDTKRIAKNTMFLYIRMVVIMFISLFTSRIVLNVLGESDYGIYNVIGGLVAMFASLSGAMSVATSRFLTYALGEGDKKRLSDTFSTALNVHIVLAVIIFIIAELLGVWFLNHYLNIPEERMYSANWVLQFSIFVFVIGILFVPYSSSIISHEKMNIYAYLSLYDASVKLLIVYLLYISPIDKLIVYAFLLTLANLSTQVIYLIFCHKHFEECKYHFGFDKLLLKKMFSFIGWAFLGNASVIAKNQSLSILLNIFFNTAVNAAQGVAMQVNNAVVEFIRNFMTAVNPQITKSYAQGNYDYFYILIARSAKFSIFMALILIVPIIMHIDVILNVWLVDVPLHTNNFVNLILVFSAVDCFINPLLTALLATGNIKNYEIGITIIYLLNIICIYIFFKLDFYPEMAFILNIVFKIIVLILIMIQCNKQFHFPIGRFTKDVLLIPILVGFIGFFMIFIYEKLVLSTTISSFLLSCIIVEIVIISIVWLCGLNSREKKIICDIVNKKILKK